MRGCAVFGLLATAVAVPIEPPSATLDAQQDATAHAETRVTELRMAPEVPGRAFDNQPEHAKYSEFGHWPTWASKGPGWSQVGPYSDYARQCKGTDDAASQDAWLNWFEYTASKNNGMDGYVRKVYGPNVKWTEKLRTTEFGFVYNTVPKREDFKPTWSTCRCSILGYMRKNQLHAGLDDIQHSPALITKEMINKCKSPKCSNYECYNVALESPGQMEEESEKMSLWQKVQYADDDKMRVCLARTLESFANLTSSAGSFSSTGRPMLPYYFPGFFIRREEPRDLNGYPVAAGQNTLPYFHQNGFPANTWIEVMRVGRIDDKKPGSEEQDRADRGQIWFWAAPGSGVWWNTGKTAVWSSRVSVQGGNNRACAQDMGSWGKDEMNYWAKRNGESTPYTCAKARSLGYDTIQLTQSFCGYSHELIDCRGYDRADARTTWTNACPPPHLKLMRGLPQPRAAPALDGLVGPATECMCSYELDYINCLATPQSDGDIMIRLHNSTAANDGSDADAPADSFTDAPSATRNDDAPDTASRAPGETAAAAPAETPAETPAAAPAAQPAPSQTETETDEQRAAREASEAAATAKEAEQAAAEAADRADAERARADAERARADAEKARADAEAQAAKDAQDALANQAAADKAALDKALADQGAEQAAADRAILDKALADKGARDRALAEKALADQAAAEKAAQQVASSATAAEKSSGDDSSASTVAAHANPSAGHV